METRDIERELKALANRRRIEIIKLLKKNKELDVSTIAEKIKLSFKATSKHLGVLRAAGIVEYEQRSLSYYYRLATPLPRITKTILPLL